MSVPDASGKGNQGERKPNRFGAASLALTISVLSGLVSVSTFGFGLVNLVRGSDVHLFPIDAVAFYRLPGTPNDDDPNNDEIGVSFRTEFTNTAGADYPDSVVAQSLEISVDERPFACIGYIGEARVIASNAAPSEQATPPVVYDDDCGGDLCFPLGDGSRLSIAEGSLRQTLRPGEVSSLERYFNRRAVRPAPCVAMSEAHPDSDLLRPRAEFLLRSMPSEDAVRQIVATYHVQTLRDGSFTASCTMRVTERQLRKLREGGWANFACEPGPEPQRDQRSIWDRLRSRLGWD